MKNLYSFIFAIFIPFLIFGQNVIEGKVTDYETGLPIQYASVYLNGSTIGTITDSTGTYQLKKILPPCKMVVSHIGYEMGIVELNDSIPKKINFSLTPKKYIVDEVDIFQKNLREENMKTFKRFFLGVDVWGRYAEILNENTLKFKSEYETITLNIIGKNIPEKILKSCEEITWNDDSTSITCKEPISLTVTAKEPLIVKLPLLGYKVHVHNLFFYFKHYEEAVNSFMTSTLGYYYYEPIPFESRRDSVRIFKNRLKAYYNSPAHFCRSLYERKLHENGYRVFEKKFLLDNYFYGLTEFNLDSILTFSDDYAEIKGLKDRKFVIKYYKQSKTKPLDLTKYKGISHIESGLNFINDQSIIRKNGTIKMNPPVFSPFIGTKRLGARLPNDYVP